MNWLLSELSWALDKREPNPYMQKTEELNPKGEIAVDSLALETEDNFLSLLCFSVWAEVA